MTAATSLSRRGWETARSLRQQLGEMPLIPRLLGGLVVLVGVVDGLRAAFPFNIRGDLLYHWALAREVLRGELPPGGPYEGLPAYYPPGFHVLLATASRLTGIDVTGLTAILGVAWLPLLPVATYLLARRLTGRASVALIAAVLTVFGGAYDLSPDRLWVNSLFPSGHEAYPLYPRDIVFGLLPLAAWAFIRALDPQDPRWLRWSLLAGGLLGACALVQVQLLLPIPLALLIPALVAWRRHPETRRRVAGSLLVTGLVTMAAVGPWIIGTAAAIGRNGGVVLDSSENLLPARFGFWSYPVQFGLFLPLALVGCGVVLLFLRRPDGPRPAGLAAGSWRPKPPEGALVLLPWFALPFALAVLYSPTWPLEEALRPQRLWLLAGQPAAILAAIGLVTVVEDQVVGRLRRSRLAIPVGVAARLLTVPTTVATTRLLWTIWPEPQYAHLRLGADHIPDFQAVLGTDGPRRTVLSYEDWSSLIWYRTGLWVVAVNPPGYAKLAFDPQVFTGRSQVDRRADVEAAFRGDFGALASTADRYGASQILVARRSAGLGLIDVVASLAVDGKSNGATVRPGNGWDVVDLAPGGRLVAPLAVSGPVDLELRFEGAQNLVPIPPRRVRLLAAGGGTIRPLADLVVPASGAAEWQVVPASVTLARDEQLVVEAGDALALQSIRGFVPATAPPSGWRVASQNADAVLFERSP